MRRTYVNTFNWPSHLIRAKFLVPRTQLYFNHTGMWYSSYSSYSRLVVLCLLFIECSQGELEHLGGSKWPPASHRLIFRGEGFIKRGRAAVGLSLLVYVYISPSSPPHKDLRSRGDSANQAHDHTFTVFIMNFPTTVMLTCCSPTLITTPPPACIPSPTHLNSPPPHLFYSLSTLTMHTPSSTL